jgi:Family of unknown function (DUF6152)
MCGGIVTTMKTQIRWFMLASLAALGRLADAHHSYAMFDGRNERAVEGTVAKFEWRNPHVLLWLYVPRKDAPGSDLYGFESDSVNVLRPSGWNDHSLRPGDRITVEFFPLRDGRNGGHLIKATRPDHTTLAGNPPLIAALRRGVNEADSPARRSGP